MWLLSRGDSAWTFTDARPTKVTATVVIPQEIAWRIFTKGIDRAEALEASRIDGERALAERVFRLTAIVA
jgi:hypothetical protein